MLVGAAADVGRVVRPPAIGGCNYRVGGRVKPGHDDERVVQ